MPPIDDNKITAGVPRISPLVPRTSRAERLWRSREELEGDPEFLERLRAEFPRAWSVFEASVDRREFLKVMAASLAMTGLTGCEGPPPDTILPYVRHPEGMTADLPLFYATGLPHRGYMDGILVETNMGRPTKVEGNPKHPASLGATDIFAQAAVLDLWDPDRSRVVMTGQRASTWSTVLGRLATERASMEQNGGDGLCILTEAVTSPTLNGLMERVLKRYPKARWYAYRPLDDEPNLMEGAQIAFGAPHHTRYSLTEAEVVVALDAHLFEMPGGLRYAREFASRRRPVARRMARLYTAEAAPSLTGAMADHAIRMRSVEVAAFAWQLAGELGLVEGIRKPRQDHRDVLRAIAEDLQQHRGRSVVVPGGRQPPEVHALAHLINERLGNTGKTVEHTARVRFDPIGREHSIAALTGRMAAGEVKTLLVLGGNPVYDAPGDLRFAERLKRVGLSVHMGLHRNETAVACRWHLPEAHPLESWGDGRAFDGTATIRQPAIRPLYQGRSHIHLLSVLLGEPAEDDRQTVRDYWRRDGSSKDFERAWNASLQEGVVPGTRLPARKAELRADRIRALGPPETLPDSLEINFLPDPTVDDGRYANNAWLQELPKQLTKITWDNVACLSPRDAERLSVRQGDLIRVHFAGNSVEAPAWVMPGHADDSVSLHVGYGRRYAGRVAEGRGYDPYPLTTNAVRHFGIGARVERTGGHHPLATAQNHHRMEGRHIVRHADWDEFLRNPRFARLEKAAAPPNPSLYEPWTYDGLKWGMSVNLNTCIGCTACVIACQAENNIPVVGKRQVEMGREMHWLRIDRYYKGPEIRPEVFFQPVPCMQCEKAPCEPVCPVEASIHDSEGINVQVYNRCIGTRFCSNNCPYKVRRFNFLQYTTDAPHLKAVRNPEVTVRQRGVMEKCNYCLQRIANGRIQAKMEDRPLRDGEVQTACMAVCPTEAIIFGDLNDPGSRVAREKQSPLDYELLGELNIRPRTTYLAKVRYPNETLHPPADPNPPGE